MSQCTGNALLLNDAVPNTNPFFTMEEFQHFRSGKALRQIEFWENTQVDRRSMHVNLYREILEYFPIVEYLLFSYEDKYFSDIVTTNFEINHDHWLGESKRRLDLLIIKDPFNFFASRLKKWSTLTGIQNPDELVRLWKTYANEFLGVTNYLDNEKICISYNDWFTSKTYREVLAKKIGIIFTDKGIDQVSSIGGGSSFDGMKYQGQARNMRVLERWRNYAENEVFRSFFMDGELLELSHCIFGEIPGTEALGVV